MTDLYHFRELRLNSPCDNLSAAIGMIQSHILASDSAYVPEVMFGLNAQWKTGPLQAAVALLVALVAPVDNMRWDDEAPAAPSVPQEDRA